jgi:steroid 5-alpha reductase family enzyme
MSSGLLLCFAGTLAAVLVVELLAYAVARRVGRHSGVDVAWGIGFAVVAVVAALLAVDGSTARRVTVPLLTVLWGGRLALHIWLRNRGRGEDPRYEELLSKGSGELFVLGRVYLLQGLSLWFISLPLQVAVFERTGLGVLAASGVVVWGVGLFFEAVGDHQLTVFSRDPASRGTVLDSGLWRYTRHPNYFGDAAVWWGLWLLALGHWGGLLTVLSPIAMTYLLARGTGKPLLEKGIEQRRPGYTAYIERTSGFLPLPPRRKRVS